MTFEQFQEWLDTLVRDERLEAGEAQDLVDQRRLFDLNRTRIESEFAGLVVGYIDGRELTARSVPGLLDAARQYAGQIYFEPIPHPAPGSPTPAESRPAFSGVKS